MSSPRSASATAAPLPPTPPPNFINTKAAPPPPLMTSTSAKAEFMNSTPSSASSKRQEHHQPSFYPASPSSPFSKYSPLSNYPQYSYFNPAASCAPRSLSIDSAYMCSSPYSTKSPAMLQRRYSDNTGLQSPCLKHHHRRPSVAIKFKPLFDEEDLGFREPQDVDTSDPSYSPVSASSPVNRPPSPIAERILKGEFSF